MKYLLITTLFLFASMNLTFAENIEPEEESCDEMWGAGTTNASACYAARANESSEKIVEEKYQLLIKAFTHYKHPKNIERIKASQEAWLKFRTLQCDLEESVKGGIGHVSTARCEERLTSERASELDSLLGAYDTRNL